MLLSELSLKPSAWYASYSSDQCARKLVNGLTLLVVAACCTWIFSLPLRSQGSLLGFAQDDFYYYLRVAQNFAAGRGSTLDGSTLTNGYHPLYFLLWTCASFAVRTLRGVFQLLWLLDVASCIAIFLSARTLFGRVTSDVFLSNAFAVVSLVSCVPTISFQMEVTLTLPLGFAFLAAACVSPVRYTARRCAALGLLGALTMLSRLDAGILVFLFLVGLFTVRGMQQVLTGRNMLSFSAAALPLLCAYFAINRHYFHQWLPISGMAKQLRHGWRPEWLQVKLSFSGFTLPLLAVALVGCVVALLLRKRLQPQEQCLCFAALLMPLLFYTVEMLTSAWKLWGWYLYALRFSLLASAVLMLVLLRNHRASATHAAQSSLLRATWLTPMFLSVTLLTLTRTHYKVDPVMLAIAKEDIALQQFAGNHPGIYAMGDRAGMFGYLSSSPLIQAEGLMMDARYLQHIRQGDDLLQTLRNYRVNYYVQYLFDSDAAERLRGNCLQAQEPSIAGRDALRMQSLVCDKPVASLPGASGTLYIYHLSTAG